MKHSTLDTREAVHALKHGEVIVYPTDTVYGLGADIANDDAVMLVRRIKQRVDDKPILALVADMAMLEEYARLTPIARALAEEFLPGPLSLILTACDGRLKAVMGTGGAVGFRMPNHEICIRLAKELGRPITSTSLNRAGLPQPRTLPQMLDQIGEQASMIEVVIDEGELKESPPSTVIDARGKEPIIVREGAISREALASFF